ncbi:ATP-binding protein [Methyloceanibacter sp. wino2]|uniref:ATP-binding protein n=1 Tax=Methyloceanibacter sp. wino2 TaxID=2170729 RepID=UPI000D3ED6E2|nr:ATP-binding protein [Methyloceanibacter sp. wino2]
MNTLRVKISVLLVIAIVSVMALMTFVLFLLLGPPPRSGHALDIAAKQVAMVAELAAKSPETLRLRPETRGHPYSRTTDALREKLKERGYNIDVVVTHSRRWRPGSLAVWIPIQDKGWLPMPITRLPPQGVPWWALLRWLFLITVGATAVAVFASSRMVRPLVFLENAVESVGPDGMMSELPEKGPAEVRATARALNSLSARLKRAMESRMRLVAAAGHDMRTPITRMRLRAEFVPDEEDREKWLNDIDELERIADSAILLVREETGAEAPERVDLDDLVGSICTELKQQDFDVTLAATHPVTVLAGRLKLNRALRNLIINAATHGVRARVGVGGDGTNAMVTIEDDGPGIPEEVLGQVFEPFFRADPARRQNIPGAGLGLTIAHEIVTRAGGSIQIVNRPGGGLLQTVFLPELREPETADTDSA